MRFIFALSAALAVATPAFAEASDAVHEGMTLRDVSMARLGKIDRVNEDGSLQVIFRSKFVTIPANAVVVTESGEVTTTLSKSEIAKLR